MVVGWFPGFTPESFSLEQGVVSEFSIEKISPGLHRYYGRCRKHLALINGVLMTHGPRQDFARQAIRHARPGPLCGCASPARYMARCRGRRAARRMTRAIRSSLWTGVPRRTRSFATMMPAAAVAAVVAAVLTLARRAVRGGADE